MKKITQYLSPEYLKLTKTMTPTQIAVFLDEYQSIFFSNEGNKKLISMRVPEVLLGAFKKKCHLTEQPYQRKIVNLMRQWILKGH